MTQRRWRAFRAALGASLLLLASATPSFAQAGKGASDPDPAKSATQMLYNEGIAAAKKGDWEKAYQSFQAAWKLREHWQIAANLGRSELKTGRYVAATEHLSFFLREAKNISSSDRAEVQKLLNEAKQHVATLIVKVNRPGAEVVLDGNVVGQAPLSRELYMDAGSHTVEARLGAERSDPVTVDISVGQSRQVGLTFGGGMSTAEAPKSGVDPVKPATQEQETQSTASRGLLIAGGVTAGAALVSGVVFYGLSSASRRDEDEDLDKCFDAPLPHSPITGCNTERDQRDQTATFTNVSIWSFVGAGVTGAATLIYALTAPREPRAGRRTVVVPVATATGGGVSVLGRW